MTLLCKKIQNTWRTVHGGGQEGFWKRVRELTIILFVTQTATFHGRGRQSFMMRICDSYGNLKRD